VLGVYFPLPFASTNIQFHGGASFNHFFTICITVGMNYFLNKDKEGEFVSFFYLNSNVWVVFSFSFPPNFPLNSNLNVDIFVVLYSMGARWQKHLNLGGTVMEV
jgi:hypothetical protein